jgi:hypothetical protein
VTAFRGVTALSLVSGLLLLAGPAGGANLPSTTYVDKPAGYKITIPTKWQIVPPSVAAVKAKVAKLTKQKKTQLAGAYSLYISTAAARQELTQFRFRAFMWPALPSPVPTDISLRIEKIPTRFKASDLPTIGATFRKQLLSPGATISQPRLVKLGAGRAVMLTGTVPLPSGYGGAKTGFTLVILFRPGRLYLLSFRIDSRAAKDANIFASIADHFRFV